MSLKEKAENVVEAFNLIGEAHHLEDIPELSLALLYDILRDHA